MQISDFNYDLPEGLIAKLPLAERDKSRLLLVDKAKQSVRHNHFKQIVDYLDPGDCLVLNNTKVMQSRFYAIKSTGGKAEILLERVVSNTIALAHIGTNKKLKINTILLIDGFNIKVIDKQNGLFILELIGSDTYKSWFELMQAYGNLPLPPYLQRVAQDIDLTRYQTVYAQKLGAVAAPTAGLHFNEQLLNRLKAKGIKIVEITLHVGAGTFQPVRVDNIDEHQMHEEQVIVDKVACDAIRNAKRAGNRVFAVGTTSLRAIESAALASDYKVGKDNLNPYMDYTNIFIKSGFKFRLIDGLITNFHLPKSTLLMLVSALMGHELMLKSYAIAIKEKYRFFSYGDAMFISLSEIGKGL